MSLGPIPIGAVANSRCQAIWPRERNPSHANQLAMLAGLIQLAVSK